MPACSLVRLFFLSQEMSGLNIGKGLAVRSVSDSPLNCRFVKFFSCLQRITAATSRFNIVKVYPFAFYYFLVQYCITYCFDYAYVKSSRHQISVHAWLFVACQIPF